MIAITRDDVVPAILTRRTTPRAAFATLALALALGAGPASAAPEGATFLADLPTGFTDPFDGTANSSRAVGPGTVDGDASRVVFESRADGLSDLDDNRFNNIFVRDQASGQTILVSVGADGAAANGDSSDARIDDGGTRVIFASKATNLVADAPAEGIYVRDLTAQTTTLVSRTDGPSGAPAEHAGQATISGTGMYVAFTTDAPLATVDTNGVSDVYARNLASHDTELVSRATGISGAPGNGGSGEPSIEGFAVAFSSEADNLVAGVTDANNRTDVFKRTLAAAPGGPNTTTLVSARDAAPTSAGDGASGAPSLSAGGTLVAYDTYATDLDSGVADSNGRSDVVLRRLATGDNELISRADGATGQVGDDTSRSPALTTAGSDIYVAFASHASNLAAGATDGVQRVYLRHFSAAARTTQLVARGPGADGAPADQYSYAPAVDVGAEHVMFTTGAANLGVSDGEFLDVIVRTVDTGVNALVSKPSAGELASGLNHGFPAEGRGLSADGRFVLFSSAANRLLPAGAVRNEYHVFRRDLLTGATVFVDRVDGAEGAPSPSWGQAESISADGARVAFTSGARLDVADANDEDDVYVRDLSSGRTYLASRADGASGTGGDRHSSQAMISADGRRVAFTSSATNLGVPDERQRVWMRDLEANTTTLVSRADGADGADGAPAGARAYGPSIDADGTVVSFTSTAANLDGKNDDIAAVFVRDLEAHTTRLVAREKMQSRRPRSDVSDDGRSVAFDLGTLSEGAATPGDAQVYVKDLASGTTVQVSRASGSDGAPALEGAQLSDLSADGRTVAFYSPATNLGAGAGWQLWVRRLGDATTTLASRADGASGVPLTAPSSHATLSADGSCLLFGGRDPALWPGGQTPDFHRVAVRVLHGSCPLQAAQTESASGTGAGAAGGAGGSVPDTLAPALLRLAISPRPVRTGRKATIRFTLSEAARVTLTFERVLPGRRARGACRAPSRRLRRAKRCTRYQQRGTLTHTSKAGTARVVFSGRFGRRALATGRYRLVAQATDAAGNRSVPRRVRFTVRRG